MSKKSIFQELALRPPANGQPLFRWIYDELRAAVLDGRLPAGGRLPSTRNLANQYGVARGTVMLGFEQLRAEGYLEGRIAAGSFVSHRLTVRSFRARALPRSKTQGATPMPKLSSWNDRARWPFPLSG